MIGNQYPVNYTPKNKQVKSRNGIISQQWREWDKMVHVTGYTNLEDSPGTQGRYNELSSGNRLERIDWLEEPMVLKPLSSSNSCLGHVLLNFASRRVRLTSNRKILLNIPY